MEMTLHRGAGEDEGEVVLLLGRLEPRGGAFFLGGDYLLRLDELMLRLAEVLGGRPKDVVEAVKIHPRSLAAAAGEGTALRRLYATPFLHWRADGGAPGLVVVADSFVPGPLSYHACVPRSTSRGSKSGCAREKH